MKRLITTTFFIFLGFYSSGQAGLKSSSINSAGGLKISNSSKLALINSTSQSSSIKTHKSNKFFLRQGFIQPLTNPESFGMASISIYPNPTKGIITIGIEGRDKEIELIFFNLQGRVILTQSVLPNNQIDLSHLPKGLYHVAIKQYGSYLGTRKIVIQ